MADSFPRQQARTRRFTIGAPRALRVSPDGERVTFLRTKSGDDPVSCLWEATAGTGAERLVADPKALGADDENLPPEERARRERVRETGSGIVAYATDERHALAVFALSGQVYAAPLGDPAGKPRLVATHTPALDPRPDPTGRKVGYVHAGRLWVADLETGDDTIVAGEDGVTYGLAEFIASEEMGRFRGYWWSPDGTRLLVARVNESNVRRWHIADPANPDRQPAEVGYPAAGTPNADVSLFIADLATGTRTTVQWDNIVFPYLVNAAWDDDLLIVAQTRDQKAMRLFNGITGEVIREDTDPHWTDIIDGTPAQLRNGHIVWTELSDDTRRLIVAPAADLASAAPLTPPGLQVRDILGTDGDSVLFSGSTEPTEIGVWRYGPDGLTAVATDPGVHTAQAAGATTVVSGRTLRGNHVSVRMNKKGKPAGDIAVLAEEPNLPHPDPQFLDAGAGDIRTAVLFPSRHRPGTKLPVLMDPYGGPHSQRVLKTASAFLASQWFAEQGFAVVVADGRGTPGRGPGTGWWPATSPPASSRTRSPRCTRRRRSSPTWMRAGSGSAAGRSAGTSRRSRCCAVPTSSAPRSPARRSPTGGCTTRTTPSATWVTRQQIPPLTRSVRSMMIRNVRWLLRYARCSSFTGWPTTTCSSPTPCGCPRRCSRPATRTPCCRCPV